MTGEVLSRQARAGETKKRRTREKLIQAADYVMREVGMSATVEEIAEEAGVSTATFYSFYRSRNDLCETAFMVLVLDQVQLADLCDFKATANLFLRLCEQRPALVQAAVHSSLTEDDDDIPDYGGHIPAPPRLHHYPYLEEHWTMADEGAPLAWLLVDDVIEGQGYPREDDPKNVERIAKVLSMVATELLLSAAHGKAVDAALLEDIVRLACWPVPRE